MFIPKDYTGLRFGLLTIEKKIGISKDRTSLWMAICDCGNIVERSSATISAAKKLGYTQSCGCHKGVILDKDVKYGYLTPIKRLEATKNRGYKWLFKCDCGNLVEKIGAVVKNGRCAQHCGCKESRGDRKNDLTGQIFGKLKVIKRNGISSDRKTLWLCKCECGGEISVRAHYLKTMRRTHCGCGRKNIGEKHPRFKGCGEVSGTYWRVINEGAKQRKLCIDITIEFIDDLFKKQNKKCALSGVEISLSRTSQTASLDRIDSSKGYTEENVQWVHKQVNTMKMGYDQDEFIEFCRKIAAYRT